MIELSTNAVRSAQSRDRRPLMKWLVLTTLSIITVLCIVHIQLFGKNVWYSLLFSHRFHGIAFAEGGVEYDSLSHYDLSNCSFVLSPVFGCDVTDCCFDGSVWPARTAPSDGVIHNSVTSTCRFIRTSFRRAKLIKADFSLCTFQNVDFEGADLSGARFNNCTFTACNLKSCNLEKADFRGSSYDPYTQLPIGFHVGDHFFVGNPTIEEPANRDTK